MGVKRGKLESTNHIPKTIMATFNEMLPHLEQMIPESTVCRLIGLEEERWAYIKNRFPVLAAMAKKASAAVEVELQATVRRGGQGWQAAATLLERLRPEVWSRTSVVTKQKAPPLHSALGSRVQRKKQKSPGKLVPMPKAGGERG